MTYINWRAFLKNNDNHCIVYGAGVIAQLFGEALQQDKEYTIDFFAVSYQDEIKELLNIPVNYLQEGDVPSDAPIVVAAKDEFKPSILQRLYELGYTNIFVLGREEWQRLIPETNHLLVEWSEEQRGVEMEKRRTQGEYLSPLRDRRGFATQFRAIISEDGTWCKILEDFITGLDETSVETVYQIIGRLYKTIFCEEVEYTQKEREECIRVSDELKKNVFQISKNHFVYKNYHLPVKLFESNVFYYEYALPTLHNLSYKEKDMIDAGGFIGDSALILSNYTNGKVHTFEAETGNFNKMKTTMEMNQNTQIVPVNLALSDAVGSLQFFVFSECHGANRATNNTQDERTISVPCTTIDAYVKEHNLTIGLIKTDVEGAEKALLRGAIETLKTQKPTLIISIYHSMDDFFTIKPWIEAMDLGYTFRISRPIYQDSFMMETVLIAEVLG